MRQEDSWSVPINTIEQDKNMLIIFFNSSWKWLYDLTIRFLRRTSRPCGEMMLELWFSLTIGEKFNHHICCNMLPMAGGCPPHHYLGFSFILLNAWTGNSEIEKFIWFSTYILWNSKMRCNSIWSLTYCRARGFCLRSISVTSQELNSKELKKRPELTL